MEAKKVGHALAGLLLACCLAACIPAAGTGSRTVPPQPRGTGTGDGTAAPPPPSPAADGGSVDPAAMLAAHNQWRAKTGVPDLVWSPKLAAAAQSWADRLAGADCWLKHSGSSYGENLYTDKAPGISPQTVVDAWGREIRFYNYADNSCSSVCGHYTQVVWRNSKELGCARAVCGDGAEIWVCNYSPAGNIVGRKPY